MTMSDESVILHTQAWIRDFIVEHNICPFARKELERGSIFYEVYRGHEMEGVLSGLMGLCQKLDGQKLDGQQQIETALFILPVSFKHFDSYLDCLEVANSLLIEQGYEGIYQLASFHPDYCFEGVDADDASNYTNRSPYPMLHLIREAELEKVLERYPNPEKIPERNVSYCQQLGREALEEILQRCHQAKS